MSDERKGISLRTKRKPRPNISAPKPISSPVPKDDAVRSNKQPADNVQQRPRPSGKTSDLVKRRYSARLNLPAKGITADAPPLPLISPQYATPSDQGGGAKMAAKSHGITVDMHALRDPSLQPAQYVTGLLSVASEQDIEYYQQSLKKMRNRASADIQKNVYQNRTQFIKISKEAEKLKGEMRALRNLMSELKNNTTALRSTSSGPAESNGFGEPFPSALSKRDKRSSVADRSVLWNSQLQALWKTVSGSQKFLPAVPGRHVIQNAGAWVELDNATWRPRRSMHIVLLNDHLLVASRRKRREDGPDGGDSRQAPSKLVADRCWPLLDIEMIDLADGNEAGSSKNKVADAIMVRSVTQESFTYRTENADSNEKISLLLNFRKSAEGLRKELRSDIENSNKTRETLSYFASRDPGLLNKAELLETLSDIKDRPNMLIEVDGKQQTLRWVEAEVDQLDIDIALQRFDSAVDRVEKLKDLATGLDNNVMAQDFTKFRADERASKLASLISHVLVDSHNELSKTQRNVGWLSRLGFEDRAREVYLEARSQTIHKRSKQCIFEGNLHQYIWEISFIYFMIIRNTVSTFQACFPPLMMSVCVKWAKEQVDAFNVILLRQLSSTERGGPIWTECINQAKEHARLLSDVALDFEGLVGRENSLSAQQQQQQHQEEKAVDAQEKPANTQEEPVGAQEEPANAQEGPAETGFI